MRLTLAWLSLCLAIYCGGGHGHGNVVLSLPPSLIATATKAALSHQRQQQQHQKKDARVLFDSPADALRDMMHNGNGNGPMDSGKFSLSDVEQPTAQRSEDFNRNADDLGARQSAPQEIAMGMELGMGLGLGPNNYRTTPPHRYWGQRCQGRSGGSGSSKCPQEYYRTMLAARNKEALSRLHMQLSSMQDSDSGASSSSDSEEEDVDDEEQSNNEVFMLLTGEQDLMKFLHWAMQLLYPIERPLGNLSDGAAENYYPGMFLWKKLNLSGHLEPPLIVDEPQYVLVRREKLFDGYQFGEDMSKENDPFIPPRGRKHSGSLDLDALMNRYEPFVPNRGKRDKVKDLFKYDDLFYPHRGKKHRNLFQVDDPFFATRGKKLQLRDLYNADDPFVPNRGKRHLTASAGKLGERMAGGGKWPDDSNNYWPLRMSTHKINGYDQSVRPSLSVEDAAASLASWRLPANRLHSTRSMSADLPQQLLLPHVRFIGNPNMRQQQQQHQVKTSSWPAEERLRRSILAPGEPNDAHEKQLTQSHPANPHLVSDTDNLNI
ncbi:uncharacterized protein LOC117145576 isoform X1 [Drosophila mauritiana]|uniref:Uncharacterized protein LOC117145576 isoform X1 n=1 Tax=Drosophila mauritiana TaxID=7226 RepID=A0A6P8KE80_DROMA|nr:uncharacterized protein LOC117145576 isoform X1 [Drosophila mauritiana]